MVAALLQGITGRLHVELSEPTERITDRLLNRKASASARITSVALEASAFDGENSRELSAEELATVAFPHPEIVIRGLGMPVRHVAPNGTYFTVRDLLAAIEETERQTRPQSSWFGGVDVHHVFFEGLYPAGDGVWEVSWGS